MAESLTPADLRAIPASIQKVGVFVNERRDQIAARVDSYHLEAVQLHGDETGDSLRQLRSVLPEATLLIKAFGMNRSFDFTVLNDYQDCCDFFLFDTKTANYGGSGRRFDLDLLDSYQLSTPLFISGGIGSEDIGDILGRSNRSVQVIDLNSRLESRPGLKDVKQVAQAIRAVRTTKEKR
jgi:phosphoribosylanthranilate isomerase